MIGIAGAGLLYAYSPAELVRSELIRQVKLNTGRDLRIAGDAHVIFYPSIGVSLGKVELSSAPGMRAGPMLVADRIDLSVALLPLLGRRVHIEHIALVRPIIELRVDRTGRQNWTFAQSQQRPPLRLAHLGTAFRGMTDAGPAATSALHHAALPLELPVALLDKFEFRSVSLFKAGISYHDERTASAHRIEDLNLRLTGQRFADPLNARGDFLWREEKVQINARLDTLSTVLAGRPASASLELIAQPLSAEFEGTLTLGVDDKPAEASGQTQLNGASLATAMRWLGVNLPNAAPLGRFEAAARVVGQVDKLNFDSLQFKLGPTTGNGLVHVALRPTRPYVSADLNISDLDLDRLQAGFADASTSTPVATSVRMPERPAGEMQEDPPQSIEDLLRRSQFRGPISRCDNPCLCSSIVF